MANLIHLLTIFVLALEVVTALSIVQPPQTDDVSINYCDPSQCLPCPKPVCNCPKLPVIEAADTIQPVQTLDEQPATNAEVDPAIQLYRPISFPRPRPFPRPLPYPRPLSCTCPPCPQIKIQCACPY